MQSQDRLSGLNQGGPRQRAEALAALNSAFNSSSATKTNTPKPSGKGQGSQRAAAVAALSTVLSAEKKKPSPDASPVASSSPVAESGTPGNKCSYHYPSVMLHTQNTTTGTLSIFCTKYHNGFSGLINTRFVCASLFNN